MLNQATIYEDQLEDISSTQIMTSFFSYPPISLNSTMPSFSLGCHQPFKSYPQPNYTTNSSLIPSNKHHTPSVDIFSSTSQKMKENDHDLNSSHFGGPSQLLSLQRSTSNLWQCMNNKRNRDSQGDPVKIKKIKLRMVREPRFCFQTMSDIDVLDDGYKWRKYGQKVVKNTKHPRSYYRCTHENCRVKKRIERLAEDLRMVITSYEGRHAHPPPHDEDDEPVVTKSGLTNFFW